MQGPQKYHIACMDTATKDHTLLNDLEETSRKGSTIGTESGAMIAKGGERPWKGAEGPHWATCNGPEGHTGLHAKGLRDIASCAESSGLSASTPDVHVTVHT